MMKSNPENTMNHSVSIQDSAYNLYGDMLLEKKTKEIREEIESEKGTEAETAMKDFFIRNEQKHLQIIEHNCRVSKGSLINHIHAFHEIAQIAAVLIVCLMFAGGIALAASPYIRIQVMQLLAKATPEYTELNFSVEKELNIPSDWQGKYYPGIVPEKSVVSYYESDDSCSRVDFSKEGSHNGWILSFSEYDGSIKVRIDTENAELTSSLISGHDVTIMKKDGIITIYWSDNNRLLILQTQHCSLSETITYASNVIVIN